jgi:hypothetical protein
VTKVEKPAQTSTAEDKAPVDGQDAYEAGDAEQHSSSEFDPIPKEPTPDREEDAGEKSKFEAAKEPAGPEEELQEQQE